MNARYYDPTTGRFISQDSYRGDGERFWHLYAYCNGDPVNFTDPTGHKAYQLYNSADSAAIAFAREVLVLPVGRRKYGKGSKEKASFIYKKTIFSAVRIGRIVIPKGKNKYFYSTIRTGEHNNVVSVMFKKYLRSIQAGLNVYAFVHSHPACDCHLNHIFSSEDRLIFGLPGVRKVYLVAPANARARDKRAFSLYDCVYRINSVIGKQTRIWKRKIYKGAQV